MNLLGVYSDSDESDTEKPQQVTTTQTTSIPMTSTELKTTTEKDSKAVNDKPVGKNKHVKKKRKLDISFLPENIQAALTRGGDDSSDDELMENTNRSSLGNKNITKSSTSALFNLLPKPKISSDANDSETVEKIPDVTTSSVRTEAVPRVTPKQSVLLESDGSDNNSDDSSEDESADQNKNSIATGSSSGEVKESYLPSSTFSIPKPRPQPEVGKATTSLGSSLVGDQPSRIRHDSAAKLVNSRSNTSVPPTIPDLQQQSHQFQQPLYPQSQPQQTYDPQAQQQCNEQHFYQPMQQQYQQIYQQEYDPQHSLQNPGQNTRKREREIQNLLLRGDVTGAMDLSGSSMKEVKQDTTWDDSRYREQKQKEAEMQKMFGGSNSMIAQPTKNQNRKHQINSLVYSAAQSELELLEARARQGKTKSETQAKYGW